MIIGSIRLAIASPRLTSVGLTSHFGNARRGPVPERLDLVVGHVLSSKFPSRKRTIPVPMEASYLINPVGRQIPRGTFLVWLIQPWSPLVMQLALNFLLANEQYCRRPPFGQRQKELNVCAGMERRRFVQLAASGTSLTQTDAFFLLPRKVKIGMAPRVVFDRSDARTYWTAVKEIAFSYWRNEADNSIGKFENSLRQG